MQLNSDLNTDDDVLYMHIRLCSIVEN